MLQSCGELVSQARRRRNLPETCRAERPYRRDQTPFQGKLQMRKTLFLAAAAVTLLAGAAMAQPPAGGPPPGGPGGGPRMPPAERFAMMDANKDGGVDKTEWRGPAERFDAIDANKDGKITLAEMEAAPAAPPRPAGD